MGKRILGLDLGTNSIGWAVVDDLGSGQFDLVKRGVHIFPEGTNKDSKGSESSKAAERTKYRSARRLKYRRKLRKIETLKVLSDEGFCPKLEKSELNAWRYDRKYPETKGFCEWWKTSDPKGGRGEFNNPYYLRWLVSTEKVDLSREEDRYKLGRAFYHMAQRRGFKSNRLDAASDDAKGDLRDRMIEVLEHEFFEQIELCNEIEELAEGLEDKTVLRFHKTTLNRIKKQPDLDTARAFLREYLNKRENLGKVKGGIVDLTNEMDAKGCQTLGQLFWLEYYKQGKRIRNQYTSREEHYEAEFAIICDKQELSKELRKKLYDAVFYQRFLKSQKGLVAKCPFEQRKKRAPTSHPVFEEFRMWQILNNIKIQPWDEEALRFLSIEEKESIVSRFFRAKVSFDFSDIAKELTPENQKYGYVGDKGSDAHVKFNYRVDQSIAGCPFTAALKSKRLFGIDYESAIFEAYNGKKVDKNGKTKTPKDVVNEVWHVLFSFNKPEMRKAYAIKTLGLDEKKAEIFSKINPKQGYGALSLTAIRRILPFLKKGYLYPHAVFLANLPNVIGVKVEGHPELVENLKVMIDNHDRDQKTIKLVNYFHELRKTNSENVEYWCSKGWNQWCNEIFKASKKLFGIQRWEDLGESGQENLCKEARKMLGALKDDDPFISSLTIENKIKNRLRAWADEQGRGKEIEKRLGFLYHPSKEEPYEPVEKGGLVLLGNPEITSIRNPVFNRAMHRLKAVINELIRTGEIGTETVVHVEIAREMNDANQREALRRCQVQLEKQKEADKKAINELLDGREADDSDALRYKLRREQRNVCLYCGGEINVSDFMSADYQIEHTIPRSRCCDNSQQNKTLAHRSCNAKKGSNIPYKCANYDEIFPRITHWKQRIDNLERQIDAKKRATRNASDKQAKDKIIQDRLVLQFERDYLWQKYRRFTMKDAPEGFKNSQLVDTRIITKYARNYLQSVFSKVHTVNGAITDDFRHYWGLQNEFGKKDRSNHTHHAVDAIVVACITRTQYQLLAEAYRQTEQKHRHIKVKEPWTHFTEDMKNLKNEILISHYAPNHLLKQTKKKARKNGRVIPLVVDGVVQMDEKGTIIPKYYEQGKTARGSLHQETFYGAIKRIETDKKGKVAEVIKYVVRKPLTDLSDKDLNKIVDDRVREIAITGREKESKLKKEIEVLKKKKPTSDEAAELVIKQQIQELEDQLLGLYTLPNKNGSPMPIKRVRVYSNVTNPISLKSQRDNSSKNPKLHKEYYWVNNGENFCISIYEGAGRNERRVRSFRAFSNFAATNQAKELNGISFPNRFDSFEKSGISLEFKFEMKPGIPVLFCDGDDLEDIQGLNTTEISRRLYLMYGIKGDDGRSKFRFHQEARIDKEQESPVSSFKIKDSVSKLWISTSKLDVLVGGIDFKINVLGEIEFMKE